MFKFLLGINFLYNTLEINIKIESFIKYLNMKTVTHLDCSLRDGGYYNNWDFKDDLINQYLQVLESINIDYCEIGFRFYNNKGFKGSCAFSTGIFIFFKNSKIKLQ